jgi:hypothetical protein
MLELIDDEIQRVLSPSNELREVRYHVAVDVSRGTGTRH